MLHLPGEVTDQIKPGAGRTALQYRVAWARSKLKAAGLTENPAAKVWALTEEGKQKVSDLLPSRQRRNQTANNRKNGKKTLWCEVKSFSSKFSNAELTPTEFRTAQQKGESYWLYIVENVKNKNPQILRIQNPVDKVFRYRIGSDWRTVATY